MLGWDIVIFPLSLLQATAADRALARLASWSAGLGGTQWIAELCASGEAADLGGNGYPNRYVATAAVLRAALRAGPPSYESAPVIGDDYYLPSGWIGSAEIDREQLDSLPVHTLLAVEAWDQS